MRPLTALLLLVLLLSPWSASVAVAAEDIDQLLREASAYLDRGSCESAQSILDEVPAAQRDERVHLLAARVTKCLDDVRGTAQALRSFDQAGGADPVAEELRRWVGTRLDDLQATFDEALAAESCADARTALARLEAGTGEISPLNHGLIALCDRDLEAVSEILGRLDDEQSADPRAVRIREFKTDLAGQARADLEKELRQGECDAAAAALRRLEAASGKQLHSDRGRIGQCRGDVVAVLEALAELGRDRHSPHADELGRFVEDYREESRERFDGASRSGDCDEAETALSRIQTAQGEVSRLDHGMLARCRGERVGVERVLDELTVEEREDARVALLRRFLDDRLADQRAKYDERIRSGDCPSAQRTLDALKAIQGYEDLGEGQRLIDLARLRRCEGKVRAVADLLDRPALDESDEPVVAELREWLASGAVPVSFEIVADGVVLERGETTRGSVVEGTTTLPLSVPPGRAPVSFSFEVPATHDPLRGAYAVQLDPRRHPAIGASGGQALAATWPGVRAPTRSVRWLSSA